MTNNYLPSNLIEAEQSVLKSVIASMNDINEVRMSVKLKFEGLRIMPLALRLYNNLINEDIESLLLWPDAGATALAKRDVPEMSAFIKSFKEALQDDFLQNNEKLLIAVSPQHYDYEEFEKLCNQYNVSIIMLNGNVNPRVVEM